MVIIQFDPDDFYITAMNLVLESMGFKVNNYALNLFSADELLKKVENKEIIPDIALVEAHMGVSEFDGQKIAERLKKAVPKIKIIGFSTYGTKEWADVEALKSLKDNNATIIKALSEATGKEYPISNVKDPSD
jgi:FixJ family two-component response regulator